MLIILYCVAKFRTSFAVFIGKQENILQKTYSQYKFDKKKKKTTQLFSNQETRDWRLKRERHSMILHRMEGNHQKYTNEIQLSVENGVWDWDHCQL